MASTTKRFALGASTALSMVLSSPAKAQISTSGPTATSLAAAQAAQTTAAPQESTAPAGDIVVTARRRAESLQSTPVTVTTFTGEQLSARGITNFDALARATPGVNFDAFPSAAPRPYFRGVGSTNQGAGGDPSSVAFLDGVYLARAPMLGIDFYDMERVEVLKGPQGTLWGKNVVGGAINFITNKPTHDAEGSGEITVAQYGQLNGNLMLNLPVTEGISTRFVLGAITNDGFRKTATGQPLDNDNKLSARGQIKFDVGARSFLLLSGDIADQNLGDNSRYNVILLPFRTGGPYGYDDYNRPRTTNPDVQGYTRSKTGGARAEFNTDALGIANWTTTLGWRTLDYAFLNDLDGTNAATNLANRLPTNGLQLVGVEQADSYSAESRLSSLGTGPLNWVLGLYYNHDDIYRERETQQQLNPPTINNFVARSRNDSYAVFGEAQYAFEFGLRLFGGGRYTKEEKEYHLKRLTGPRVAPMINFDTGATPGVFDKGVFTYRAGADMRFNENIFLFGSVSTGFKSGSFPEQPTSALLARTPTAPERATNYEAGFKTDWLDRKLRFNVSAFLMNYTDLQTIKIVPDLSQGPVGSRATIDNADARIKGVETEFVLRPVTWFDTTVRYSFLDARYTRYIQTASFDAAGQPSFTDAAGNRTTRTPRHALVADVGLQTPARPWGWLRGEVTMDYQSDIFDNAANLYTEYRRPRTLWNASIAYHPDDRFTMRLWVKNLTDVEYRTWETSNPAYLFVQYGPPRQVGATLSARFR
ncbi:TonB-dependent receptor [Sphingomonas sp. 2SG]|uniref:TonB-dependent receptor n=1 Tax=Sphingomonas sp. 2SG TaxID=2502201 RepID=UPI0010F51D60|nr:TonB-dependent receptor [Sphingomonas sp. 2SG]